MQGLKPFSSLERDEGFFIPNNQLKRAWLII
jgi:hypothetical protein